MPHLEYGGGGGGGGKWLFCIFTVQKVIIICISENDTFI